MSDMNDYRLLSELHDLKDSRVQGYLEDLRQQAIQKWTDADNDRAATIAQGEKRILDRIVSDMQRAWDRVQEQRSRRERPQMSKAF